MSTGSCRRSAFSRASATASGEESTAVTCAAACSSAIPSAIAPLPVPRSSTRGACRCRHPRAPARRGAAPRPPSLSQRAAALFTRERRGELVQLTLEHAVELMRRELDAVVGDAIFREVVGADLLRAPARSDLRAPGGVELRLLLLPLELVQASP